jgi:hypothetical protein
VSGENIQPFNASTRIRMQAAGKKRPDDGEMVGGDGLEPPTLSV